MRALILAIVLVWSQRAIAQPPERPWAVGVSETDQTRALELLTQGNALVEQGRFADGLDLYRKALAIWDHPAIRANLAVALLNLDRRIDAYQELEQALRFGPAALEPEIYQQALKDERLLRGEIVTLTIECVDAKTRVSLDAKDLGMSCPGSTKQLVRAGRHQLVAVKPGYLTRTIELAPSGGDSLTERIDLKTTEEATFYRRRWVGWKSWLVVGAGALVSLGGMGVELQSRATFRSYDRAVAVLCASRPCTELPAVVSDAYDEGVLEHRIALGLLATGGAVVVSGAVLLWLNRPIAEQIGYDGKPIVSASVAADHVTVAAQVRF